MNRRPNFGLQAPEKKIQHYALKSTVMPNFYIHLKKSGSASPADVAKIKDSDLVIKKGSKNCLFFDLENADSIIAQKGNLVKIKKEDVKQYGSR